MKCIKCGNEILENEKYCGKCGTKVSTENERILNNKVADKRRMYIIVIAIIVSILFVFIAFYSGSQRKNNNQMTNSVSVANQTLSVIDQERKEFKINANDLIKAIVEANTEYEKKERTMVKTELIYNVTKQKNLDTGKMDYCYTITYKGLGTMPFILVSDGDTNNVYRICVCHPALNDYGTELNTGAIEKNYELLGMALEKLNQKELYDTIIKIRNSDSSQGVSSDWNIRGVHVGAFEGGTNSYGNLASVYFFYATK
ncbi:MAG: zinc ribbon domain-containing protein [Bacilli bacterium]|nr:zinc ribbon domain-containing protein [Bacilli bacterium]